MPPRKRRKRRPRSRSRSRSRSRARRRRSNSLEDIAGVLGGDAFQRMTRPELTKLAALLARRSTYLRLDKNAMSKLTTNELRMHVLAFLYKSQMDEGGPFLHA